MCISHKYSVNLLTLIALLGLTYAVIRLWLTRRRKLRAAPDGTAAGGRLGPEMTKCACPHCDAHVEFDAGEGGRMADCPHCGKAFQLPALVGKPVAPEILKTVNWIKVGIVSVLGAIVVISIAVPLARRNVERDDEPHMAYFAAYKFCERYAPSGKNFTTTSGENCVDGIAKWDEKNQAWLSFGCVDCQNKFGAMRHQQWFAAVKFDGKNWLLDHLEIGSETIYDYDDLIR